MPGTYITMPHKLSDYLCAGLAVINSTEGEADDLLRRHNAGQFYQAKDVNALSAAMERYITDAGLLAAHKEKASQLAEDKFDRRKTYIELANWITSKATDV